MDHFMPVSLLGSQLEALERPAASERALRITGDAPVPATIDAVVAWLGAEDAAGAGRS